MKDRLAEAISKAIKFLSSKYVLLAGILFAIAGLFGSHYWIDSGMFLVCVQSVCHELHIYFAKRAGR